MPTPTATIFLPYHALDAVILRGTRAAQPAATAVVAGTLYCVTDEGHFIEQSTGATWVQYGPTPRNTAIVHYTFSAATTEPPGAEQLRLNAGSPYTSVTKVWMRNITLDGQDVFLGLMIVAEGATILIQDKNDHAMYAVFRTTGDPVDKTTYVEFPVEHVEHGSALGGGQPVLVQSSGGAPAGGGGGGGSALNAGRVMMRA